MFLRLSMGSSGAAVALAIIAEATDEPHRHEWAVTGSVTLAGDVIAVLGVREKVGTPLQLGACCYSEAIHSKLITGNNAVTRRWRP